MLKRLGFIMMLVFTIQLADAQCAMCTKTAASLDDKSAKGLNAGILYLAAMPLMIIGIIGFKWYQRNKDV